MNPTPTVPASGTAPLAEAATPHLRPAAHFTARDTWLNDPNGLLHHAGVYHLFFQNNRQGQVWGPMSWGHATSTDLVTWSEHDVAIPNTPEENVFSGSAVADVRNTAGFAGPGQTALVAIYTSAFTPASSRPGIQAQSLAYSLDDGSSWTRYANNPVLDTGSSDFRDPKVFWHGGEDGRWVMVAVEAVDRQVVIYTSANLLDWTRESTFGPAHAVGGIWECPDLFPLAVPGTGETKWVLVVSLNPGAIAGGSGTQYFIGDFDGSVFTPDRLAGSTEPADYDWLDYGRDYYAAVSFNDAPDGRRLTVGWASNWDYANDTPTHPWRSAMSLVRELRLVRCSDGRLRVTQLPVLPQGTSAVRVFDVQVPSSPGDRTDVVLSSGDPLGGTVTISVDGDERTLTCDRTRSGAVDFHPAFPSVDTAPLIDDRASTHLKIVVDASILEIYVDGGLVTLTQQVFPHQPLTTVHIEPSPAR